MLQAFEEAASRDPELPLEFPYAQESAVFHGWSFADAMNTLMQPYSFLKPQRGCKKYFELVAIAPSIPALIT